MKITIIAILLMIANFGYSQPKKSKPKQKELVCNSDSVKKWENAGYEGMLWTGGYSYIFHNGKYYKDTTDMYIKKRRVHIGDTLVLRTYIDTVGVLLYVELNDGIRVNIESIKCVENSTYYTYQLYEDTLTKEHSIGGSGWGQSTSMNEIKPSWYLQKDRIPFPSNYKILGELKQKP